MNIIQKSSSGNTVMSIDTYLLEQRKIMISSEINENVAIDFVKQIMYLSNDDAKPIKILISSSGGEIEAGMLMYDAIQGCKVPIETYCIGKAYSMAAVLLACAPKGSRYILPHSKVMIHEPFIAQSGMIGKTDNVKKLYDDLQATKKNMNELLANHINKTSKQIAKETAYDHFFSAEEAVRFGLCDKVITVSQI